MRESPSMSRPARWLRGLWPDRNPLRRGLDRAEAAIVAALLIALLAGVPLAALLAGGWAAALRTRALDAARWPVYRVSAVLLGGAQPAVTGTGAVPTAASHPGATKVKTPALATANTATAPAQRWVAPARWTAPDGVVRTGDVPVSAVATAASTVTITVNSRGRLITPPSLGWVIRRPGLVTFLAAVGTGLVLLALGGVAHWIVQWRRMAGWGAAWRATGPRWSRLR